MSKIPLKNKTTLITGASTGIGRAAARAFAEAGSDLALVSRDIKKLEETASEIRRDFGVRADVMALDVTDVQELRASLAEYSARRPVRAAVINAGVGQYGPFHSSPWRDLEIVLRTNIDGALATAHALAPDMAARGEGSLTFVSSVLGKRAIPWNAVYCASKHALHGLADALRLELRGRGVHVGVVCPARTDTEFFSRMIYSSPQKNVRRVPVSPPEDVAAAILRCVLRKKREVVVSAGGKAFASVGGHFPRLADFLISTAMPKHDDL